MNHETIRRGGKTYVLVEPGEFEQLVGTRSGLPPMPRPDHVGNVDAVHYARASIAREIVTRREAAGMTQTDLAKAAGVRVETVNRIENAKHTADVATIAKLDAALSAAQPAEGRAALTPRDVRIGIGFVEMPEHPVAGKRGARTRNSGTYKSLVRRDASGRIKSGDDIGKGRAKDRGTSKRTTNRKK